jgi:hypothetical protein
VKFPKFIEREREGEKKARKKVFFVVVVMLNYAM